MKLWKPLLALLAIPLLATAATAQSDPSPDHPTAGHAHGIWKKAAPFVPGKMRGRLVSAAGNRVVHVEARLVRKLPLLPCGILVGKATVVAGPRQGKTLPIQGLWSGADAQSGRFSAAIAAPHRDDGQKPKVVIRMHGRFQDGKKPGPGVFRALWKRN